MKGKHMKSFACTTFFFVAIVIMAAAVSVAQNCTPPANPHITSSFTPDSSCLRGSAVGLPDKHDCLYACELQYSTFCTALNGGSTYVWVVSSPATIVSGQGTNCVTILMRSPWIRSRQ